MINTYSPIFIEFDCPFCGVMVKVNANELEAGKFVVCHCKKLIPAEAIYDPTELSE